MTTTHDGDAPARQGAVEDVILRMRAAAAAAGRADGPGAAGSVDPSVLRTVLATLPVDDQRLLWDRHVLGHEAAAIAAELGMHARAVLHRLRRAEERLAAAFAAAHARACPPGCLDTRQSLHSYVRHRLSPVRRTVLEAHLFGCQGCMRAFIDVREAGWAVRDAGPLLLAGTAASVAAGGAAPVVVGALGAGTTGAGVLAWSGPVGAALAATAGWARALVLDLAHLGKGGLIAAGTVAGVVVATVVAVALGGGGGGPVAGPVAPAPTASVAAPAPDEGTSPAAPAEPGPDATTVPEDPPPADGTAHPGGAGPTGTPTGPAPATPTAPTAPSTPTTPTTSTPTTPSTTPTAPSTTSPTVPPTSTPTADPTPPRPSPSPTPRPTAKPTPTPTPKPTPTPTPKPTPTPDPDPVRSTVAADLPGLRGVFRVTPGQDDVDVVSVSTSKGWLRARECRDGSWYVSSRHYKAATVDVTVDAPADVAPSVSLVRTGIWPGWLQTC
ncbi:zf-HC2 domain-containing protein [Isoptericola sp. NPDC057653]|uniref:zf-HC2 domain-containing protein n=1 Tax=Isoptericola sp. NPDC057653 TaxID=3346195 RepID=UPI0036C24BD9